MREAKPICWESPVTKKLCQTHYEDNNEPSKTLCGRKIPELQQLHHKDIGSTVCRNCKNIHTKGNPVPNRKKTNKKKKPTKNVPAPSEDFLVLSPAEEEEEIVTGKLLWRATIQYKTGYPSEFTGERETATEDMTIETDSAFMSDAILELADLVSEMSEDKDIVGFMVTRIEL